VEISLAKVWAEWWAGKTFSAVCKQIVIETLGCTAHSSSVFPPWGSRECIEQQCDILQSVCDESNSGPEFICENSTVCVSLGLVPQLLW
jgi:hypothetical protein